MSVYGVAEPFALASIILSTRTSPTTSRGLLRRADLAGLRDGDLDVVVGARNSNSNGGFSGKFYLFDP